MTADTNIQITFALQLKEGESVPPEFAEYDGDLTFYFPGARVVRGLEKDLRVISMSGQTRALDLYRQDDGFQVIGWWRDDPDGEYDGRTSADRVHFFYLLNSIVEVVGWFKWESGGVSEVLKVMSETLHCDQVPGEGDIISYKFDFVIVETESSDVNPYEGST